ncbi:protein unc-13 homolog D-like isoform X2 [Amphiura filiformis]|uniref:protein unc-13 homolog D-like isoform X2 n=1 Tax=Amphiura filiformis TaxID=82378 RepID=UPI003B2137F7
MTNNFQFPEFLESLYQFVVGKEEAALDIQEEPNGICQPSGVEKHNENRSDSEHELLTLLDIEQAELGRSNTKFGRRRFRTIRGNSRRHGYNFRLFQKNRGFVTDSDEGVVNVNSATARKFSNFAVAEADGNFFENFSALPSKQGSNLQLAHTAQDQFEDNLVSISFSETCNDLPQLTKRELSALYKSCLSLVHHKLGSDIDSTDGPVPSHIDMYGHLQEVFQVDDDDHTAMLLAIKNEKKPPPVLKVTIVAARGLDAMDSNGFSDPFCVAGIIPGNRKINGHYPQVGKDKTGKDRTLTKDVLKHVILKDHLPPDKLRTTAVVSHTLDPEWDETYRFSVDDLASDWLRLEVWDEDIDATVLQSVQKASDVNSIKGVGKLFKEIAQSAANSGDSTDYMGCVNIKLSTIPSEGLEAWLPLRARSSKTRVQGEVRVNIKLAYEESKRPDQGMTAYKAHSILWYHFVHYEVSQQDSKNFWNGHLTKAAMAILSQHSVQYEMPDMQQCLSRWLAYSQECALTVMDFHSLFRHGKVMANNWSPFAFKPSEESNLKKAFQRFVTYGLDLIKRQQEVFPATNKPALIRLENLLKCLQQVSELQFAKNFKILQPDLKTVITTLIQQDLHDWYNRKHAECLQAVWNEVAVVSAMVDFTNAISVHLARLKKSVDQVYQNVFNMSYFTIAYQELARALMYDIKVCVNNCKKCAKALDEESQLEISTVLFQLYLAMRDFVANAKHIKQDELVNFGQSNGSAPPRFSVGSMVFKTAPVELPYDEYRDQSEMETVNFHMLFKPAVEQWLGAARKKSYARIKKAVELDKIALMDSMVKHSTSAVDVATCFGQIREFWKHLNWPDVVGSYVFVAKVADDMCQGARDYADIIHDKLKEHGYYDDEGQFDVTDQLCIAINNIEQVRRSLAPMPESLGWQIIADTMEKEHGILAGQQCRNTLDTMMASADEDMLNVISHVVQKVGERMQPDIRKYMKVIVKEKRKAVEDAIEPLMEYLDTNLETLLKGLLKSNFDRILDDIYHVCLEELEALATDEGKKHLENHMFFIRLEEALSIIAELFHGDGKGLSLEQIECNEYKNLLAILERHSSSSKELIENYYIAKFQQQEEDKSYECGVLNVQACFNTKSELLEVYMLNAANVLPLDSSGTSDPFVEIELLPPHLFKNPQTQKTKVKEKTLHPLFDETFRFAITEEFCKMRGACLHFTLYDHDTFTANDIGGEAFVLLQDITGVDMYFDKGLGSVEPMPLCIRLPEKEDNTEEFEILKGRPSDSAASAFISRRMQLAEKARDSMRRKRQMSK